MPKTLCSIICHICTQGFASEFRRAYLVYCQAANTGVIVNCQPHQLVPCEIILHFLT